MTADNKTDIAPDMSEEFKYLRMIEALLFAATEPLDLASLTGRLPDDANVEFLIEKIKEKYTRGGVNLVEVAGKWALRTAPDLHFLLEEHRQSTRKLSRAALETLAITAYHQPVTRAEIEEVRGVGLSRGTLDLLMELGWIKIRGRRRTLGRPVTYGTTDGFLEHFGFQNIKDLPGLDELKATGLLEGTARSDLLPLSHKEPEDPLDDDGSVFTLTDEKSSDGGNTREYSADIIDIQG